MILRIISFETSIFWSQQVGKIGLFSTYNVDQDHRCADLLIGAHVQGADIIFEEKHAGAYHLFGGGVIHKTHFMFQNRIVETLVFIIKSKISSHQIHTIIYHVTAVSSYQIGDRSSLQRLSYVSFKRISFLYAFLRAISI